MIRRLALFAALLLPVAGLAQVAGSVLIIPAAFGVNDCANTSDQVRLSWTTSQTLVDGDVYRVYVASTVSGGTTPSCSTSAVATGTKIGIDFQALTQTQSYIGGLTRSEFLAAAGASCTAATSPTVWVCVQHVRSSNILAAMSGSAPLEVNDPPVPINVSAQPGDSSLLVSWADGTSNGVAAVSYRATATDLANPSDTHTASTTGKSVWVTGLTNGVTYTVTVIAVSAGSNASGPSVEVVTGTPQRVDGFWEQYKNDPAGREQGGCAGGAAGLVSLLGVALALRGLRRRS